MGRTGFEILGARAEPAVPVLVNIARGHAERSKGEALWVLRHLGAAPLTASLQQVQDATCPNKWDFLEVISEAAITEEDRRRASPVVLQGLVSVDQRTALAARTVIGRWLSNEPNTVTALFESLSSLDTMTQIAAIHHLGQYPRYYDRIAPRLVEFSRGKQKVVVQAVIEALDSLVLLRAQESDPRF
jgi:hypothetical protein